MGLGIGKGFAKFVPKAIRLDEIDPDQYAVSGEVVWGARRFLIHEELEFFYRVVRGRHFQNQFSFVKNAYSGVSGRRLPPPHYHLQREVAALRVARHKVLLRLEACFVRGAFAYELYPLADLGESN